MFKRVGLIGGVILLSVLLLGYVFRLPLLQWVIAPQLEKAGVELSCLDFTINHQLDIHADKVCLNYQNQVLTLNNMTANTQHIVIESAQLSINSFSHNTNATSEPANTLDLTLPDNRPLMRIKQLIIKHELLKSPITVSINEPRLNHFAVIGDIDATATLYKNKMVGEFRLTDALLRQQVKTDNTALAGLRFTAQHAFTFNGLQVSATGHLNADYLHTVEHCQIAANTQGNMSAKFDLNNQVFELDVTQLTSQISLTSKCENNVPNSEYKAFLVSQFPRHWQLLFPDVIRLKNGQLNVPAIELNSKLPQQVEFSFFNTRLALINPLQHIQSQLNVQINTPEIANVTLTADMNNEHIKGRYDIALASLPSFSPIEVTHLKAHGDFSVSDYRNFKAGGSVGGDVSFANAKIEGAVMTAYSGHVTANITDMLDTVVTLTSHVKNLRYDEYILEKLNNELTAKANIGRGEMFVNLKANTTIDSFESSAIKLRNIDIVSTGLQSRALKASHHGVINGIELVAKQYVFSDVHTIDIVVPEQSVLPLNAIISQFEPLAQVTTGTLNGRFSSNVNLQKAQFYFAIDEATGLYNDYLARGFNTQLTGRYNSGQLNIVPTTFNIDELRSGAVVNNIAGHFKVNDSLAEIYRVKGAIFEGDFALDTYTLGKLNQVSTVEFKNVDASELITLDDKSGITLTGQLKGTLPIQFNENGVEVIGGNVTNQGEGKLLITNNAAFDSVMQQQQELKPVLSLLTDLDISSLNSSVALKPDGWLNLGVNLQGYNEAQAQQVNFNYNHEENIFTLLRALRLSDEITQKVEQQYSQKGNE
jgi:hypothetical protein